MPLTASQLDGRTVRWLGANNYVNLNATGFYTIFTTGGISNRAPESNTVVAFCSITPNVAKTAWDAGTNTFRINLPMGWEAVIQDLANYAPVPAVMIASGRAFPNGTAFLFEVIAGNANNGIATVAAYGWTI